MIWVTTSGGVKIAAPAKNNSRAYFRFFFKKSTETRPSFARKVMTSGNSKTSLASMIKFLERYIQEHFKTEEEIMRMVKYPHINSHIRIHKEFNKLFENVLFLK